MDKQVGRVSGLLLADSGFAPLNPPEWIATLQPQVVLLSVSPKDATGLPSPETLEAVEGYSLLRTDRNGWIELTHGWGADVGGGGTVVAQPGGEDVIPSSTRFFLPFYFS